MGNSDGSIVIDTELDSSDFEQGSKKLHSKIEDVVEKINRLGASIKSAIADALRGITAAPLDTVGQSAQEVQGRVDELGRSKSLSQLQSQISTVNRQIAELEDKLAQDDAAKAPFIQQAEELRQRIKEARAEVEQCRQAWVNGVPGADKSQSEAQEKAARLSAQYNEVVAQIDKMDASLGRTGSKLDGLRQKAAALAAQLQAATSPASGGEPPDQMTPLAERIRGAFTSAFEAIRNVAKGFAGTVKSGFSRIASAAKQAAKSVLSFGKSQKKMNTGLKSGFMTMLKYAFGIRSLYALFNRLRNAIKEGFGNLAQFSDRTNAAISSMMSALTQFKNSIAAAFDPILRIAAPALTQLINLLTQAATKLGALLEPVFIRWKSSIIKT